MSILFLITIIAMGPTCPLSNVKLVKPWDHIGYCHPPFPFRMGKNMPCLSLCTSYPLQEEVQEVSHLARWWQPNLCIIRLTAFPHASCRGTFHQVNILFSNLFTQWFQHPLMILDWINYFTGLQRSDFLIPLFSPHLLAGIFLQRRTIS